MSTSILAPGSKDGYELEHIAKALRPGKYNYISLEFLLSSLGIISQIPVRFAHCDDYR